MENNTTDAILIWLMLIVTIAVLLIIKAAEFFKGFNRDKQYIKSEKRRAVNYAEYRYWRRELRCHYLCLVPFVNEHNVPKVYNLLFHRRAHATKEKRRGILSVLAPSFIVICISLACICGASWAWFTSTAENSMEVIKTARYTVQISAKADGDESEVLDNGGVFKISLNGGKTYDINIIPNGTAKSGYCIVEFDEKTYYTEQIKKGEKLQFRATAGRDDVITITPTWGTCAVRKDENKLENGAELESAQNSLSQNIVEKDSNKTMSENKSTDEKTIKSTVQNTESFATSEKNNFEKAQSEINSADIFTKSNKNTEDDSVSTQSGESSDNTSAKADSDKTDTSVPIQSNATVSQQ